MPLQTGARHTTDVQYKAMLNEFEQFKEDVNRRFSFLLQDSTRMITAFDDDVCPCHPCLIWRSSLREVFGISGSVDRCSGTPCLFL